MEIKLSDSISNSLISIDDNVKALHEKFKIIVDAIVLNSIDSVEGKNVRVDLDKKVIIIEDVKNEQT